MQQQENPHTGQHPDGSNAATTLAEILETAISFEKSAFEFYTDLLPRVDHKLKLLIESLANEEEEHFELLAKLSMNPDIGKEIKSRVNRPAEEPHILKYVHFREDLGENPDEQAVLGYVLGRDDAAMRYYWDLAINASSGAARDLFEYLAYEETSHKRQIEKQYYNSACANRPVS